MKLHILGSGTCIPSKRRGSAGYAVICGNSKLLLDCGNGTTWKLDKAGLDYLDIDYIFITHFHPDHTSDLIPFLFGTKYNTERQRQKPLRIVGPEGFKDFFRSLNKVYNNWLDFEQLHVSEVNEKGFLHEEFEIKWLNTPHTSNSVGYRISSGGRSLVYTGDTEYCEELAEFANVCDLLLIECSHPGSSNIKGHLNPYEAAMIIANAEPKRAVITHLYPECDRTDILNQIKKHTDIDVVIAEDMMEIEV